ncbi:SbcC ATPase [Bacillus phage AR9]|uniref:SbcC ATPase n=2 Tax=Bacillus phage PBS1 TaxID=10683 RepID=A0A172JI48_BPPB1|nr:SbcC ATPase [Bacillus phage AR9]YP_009664228.1 DNA double-strand break repair ATPase [Bacillus phage PBS1]AMS01223.1 SbcC ATPase [Bacillus phage AR9]AST99848.1 DNA double-strand break repair ATPase [Bacillus phage PBS1]BDE75332.1 hypothetical protein [Bacillus phage PBS1]
MKITYARFVNFAGIYAGLGKTELELDFSKSTNKIIALIGDNGSGKTTILSLLTPYRDTNDERKSIILDGKKGEKEIHLSSEKNSYIIRHYYAKVVDGKFNSSGNKSFISKNGEELNENGGIRTFEKILQEEFNLTRDYFRVARLGSNVTTFVDLKTADRKKYINNFLPDIDDYLEAFEIVNEKFKNVTSTIKSIRSQLEKLDSKDNLEKLNETLTKRINELNKEIENIDKNINRTEGKIDELKVSLDTEGFDDYDHYINHLSNTIKQMQVEIIKGEKILDTYYDKYPNLKNYEIDRINNSIMECNKLEVELNGELNLINSQIDNLEKDIVRLGNEITSKNSIIENKADTDYIEEQIKNKDSLIEQYEKKILNSPYSDLDITVQMATQYQYILDGIVETIESIKSDHTSHIIESFNVSEIITIPNEIKRLDEKLQVDLNRKNTIEKETNKIESNSYLLETLEKRPSNCIIDTCPFIVKALDYRNNDYSRLEPLLSELIDIENSIIEDQKNLEELRNRWNYAQDIMRLNKKINSNKEVISLIYDNAITEENVIDILKSSISDIQEKFSIKDIIEIASVKVDIIIEKDKKENLLSHLKTAQKQNEIVEQAKKELLEIKEKYLQCKSEIDTLISSKKSTDKKIKNNKTKLAILETIKNQKSIIENNTNELNKKEADYQKKLNIYNSIKANEKIINDNLLLLRSKRSELEPLEIKLKEVQRDLIIIDDCTERLKEIEENYNNYKIIKEALDPKKGIPLFFIDNYLKDIAMRANNLLDIAYGDQFKIKFDISASDFFINVFKSDGTSLEDIKEASQGETSLTIISLSLGMIERMMESTKYNILYLDEVDSTLSARNRRLYTSLLESQIQELGIEQVFVISHNNEFDSSPVDLILLNGHNIDTDNEEFMQNKGIIYKY